MCQNLVPLVNIKIAGKWMFIPLKMVLIGIDPYPCIHVAKLGSSQSPQDRLAPSSIWRHRQWWCLLSWRETLGDLTMVYGRYLMIYLYFRWFVNVYELNSTLGTPGHHDLCYLQHHVEDDFKRNGEITAQFQWTGLQHWKRGGQWFGLLFFNRYEGFLLVS